MYSLAAGDGLVVALTQAGELIARGLPGCDLLWRTTSAGRGPVHITSDAVEVALAYQYDRTSGRYEGVINYDLRRWPDNEGLFVSVETVSPEAEGGLVVVDDDGSRVAVRHVEPATNRVSAPRSVLRAAPTTWSVDLEVPTGAVVALPSLSRPSSGRVARSFWVLELAQDGALVVSRWLPASS